jgi:hypothetical protein
VEKKMPITNTVRRRLQQACEAAKLPRQGAISFPDHNHFWFKVLADGRVEVYLQCWLAHTLDEWHQLCAGFAKGQEVEVKEWGLRNPAPLLVFTPA